MLNKNTNEIIIACKLALQHYNSLCRRFLGAPGTEGIRRKKAFQALLTKINNYQPDEAFGEIYQFYLKQKSSSRLAMTIHNALITILEISPPVLTGDLFCDLENIINMRNQFNETANAILDDLGTYQNNDILLLSRKT